MSTPQCPNCHRTVDAEDSFCSSCGAKLTSNINSEEPRPQTQPQGETAAGTGAEWHEIKHEWFGFAVEKPRNWELRTYNGVISICRDTQGLTCATLRPIRLQSPVKAETLARYLVGVMQTALPSFTAWQLPEQEGKPDNIDRIVMQIQGTCGNVQLEGVFCVQVDETSAQFSGYQAPVNEIKQIAPTMERILASFRSITPLPRVRFVEVNEHSVYGFVPQQWSARAVMQRAPDTSTRLDIKVSNPEMNVHLHIPPEYTTYFERPPMAFVPGIQLVPVMPATTYLERFVIPQIQRRNQGAQIEGVVNRPDIAQVVLADGKKYGGLKPNDLCEVASVQYTYFTNGQTYREKDFIHVTRWVNLGMWNTAIGARAYAPIDLFEQYEPVLMGIAESIKPDPQWAQAEQRRADALLVNAQQRAAQAQQEYIQSINNRTRMQIDIGQQMREGAKRRMAQNDHLQQNFDNIISGLQDMIDPLTGQVHTVNTGFYQYWNDGYHSYGGSIGDQPKANWHKLEPLYYN